MKKIQIKFLIAVLCSLLTITAFTQSIEFGVSATSNDNEVLVQFQSQGAYPAGPFSSWITGVFSLRYPSSLSPELVQSVTNITGFNFQPVGGFIADDGGDGWNYLKFEFNGNTAVPFSNNELKDILVLSLMPTATQQVDFEILDSTNPWVDANNGDPALPTFLGNQFSGLFNASASITLPITITSITATKLSESSARVDWTTSIELNSSHFIVQRSADLRSWESLGRVEAAGDSREMIEYSFIDNTIPRTLRSGDGTFYYRLVAVDLDEAFEISEVRSLTFDVISSMINVYPNPTSDLVVVDLGDMEGDAQLTMMDLQGRVVYTMLATDEHNRMPVINLKEHGFEAGTYLIRIEDKTTEAVETRKVLLID